MSDWALHCIGGYRNLTFITGLAQASLISRRAVHKVIMARIISIIFIVIFIMRKLRMGPLRRFCNLLGRI